MKSATDTSSLCWFHTSAAGLILFGDNWAGSWDSVLSVAEAGTSRDRGSKPGWSLCLFLSNMKYKFRLVSDCGTKKPLPHYINKFSGKHRGATEAHHVRKQHWKCTSSKQVIRAYHQTCRKQKLSGTAETV